MLWIDQIIFVSLEIGCYCCNFLLLWKRCSRNQANEEVTDCPVCTLSLLLYSNCVVGWPVVSVANRWSRIVRLFKTQFKYEAVKFDIIWSFPIWFIQEKLCQDIWHLERIFDVSTLSLNLNFWKCIPRKLKELNSYWCNGLRLFNGKSLTF